MARRRRRDAETRRIITRREVKRVVREARPRRQYKSLTRTSLEPILARPVPQTRPDVVRRGPDRRLLRNTSNVTVHFPQDGRSFQFGALRSAVVTEPPKRRKSVCQSRKQRREVIFAKSLRGKGSASKRRVFTEQSRELC